MIIDHYASQKHFLASFQAFFRGYFARVVPVLSSVYHYVVFP